MKREKTKGRSMKKVLVFVSIAIFAIALGGCQKETEVTAEPEALAEQAVVEDVQAEQETPAAVEEAPAQLEEVVVEEVIVQEEEIAVVEEPTAEPETPAAVEAVVEEIDMEAVVVTVNGQEIVEKEVSVEVTRMAEMQKTRMPPGMEMPDTMKQQMRNRVVDMKVEQILLSQEIEKNDIAAVTDEQVTEEIKKIAGQKNQTLEEVEEEIAKMGMTLEDIKGQIRSQMQMKALMESLNPDSVVTEADEKKFYDENPQHFVQKDQVKASHILCGKRGIKEDEYPAELEKIEKAKARLDAGETFEDVAKDVSTCPSSAKGGDLGFFGKGQMDPAFEKAAFELEVGQTTGVVKTSFGYHIIKLTDKTEAETTPFEEAQEKITQFLTQQKQQGFWAEYSKTMRDGATIEYSEKEQAARDEMEKAAAARAAQQAAPRTIQPAPAPAPAPKPEVVDGE
jgi:peptidyl-prolyl cis-trans isomerase C